MLPWFFQRATAIFLIFGMAVHIFSLPLGGEKLTYSLVSGRLSHTGWLIFDLLLLLSCIYHGFNGMLGIILDYNPKSLKAIGYILFTISLIFSALGIAAIGGFR